MKCYKLLPSTLQAYGRFQYHLGEWTSVVSGDDELCSSAWFHVYDSPLIAVLLNDVHSAVTKPSLFECTYDGRLRTIDDNGLKRGVKRLRLDKEVPLPVFPPAESVRIAIGAARAVYGGNAWATWAKNWLNGTGRRSNKSAADARLSTMGFGSGRACYPDAATKSARCAANAAEYADGTPAIGTKPVSVRGLRWVERGTMASARALEAAARAVSHGRDAAYWVALIEKAVAAENKLKLKEETNHG